MVHSGPYPDEGRRNEARPRLVEVFFKSFGYGGYKVRIQHGDYFIIHVDGAPAFELDASIVLDMLAGRIRDARIVGMIAETLDPVMRERLGYVSPPRLPPVAMPSDKERKRAARKSRKKGKGS